MNNIDTTQLLTQLRAAAAAAGSPFLERTAGAANDDFSFILMESIRNCLLYPSDAADE